MHRTLVIGILLLIMAACNPPGTPTRMTPSTPVRLTVIADQSTRVVSTSDRSDVLSATATTQPIQDCPSAPAFRLIVQERGQVTDNEESLNLRRGPGTNYTIITRIEPGEIFTVLDGPACAGDYAWFRIRYRTKRTAYDGWIAEGDRQQYYVAPYLPG